MRRYVIDLDHTLCIPKLNEEFSEFRYGNAQPIQKTIDKVNELYYNGNYIIIYTARRMLTYGGDVDAVVEDVGLLTKSWLEKHGVMYHELIFGKPYGDYYIDDKGMSIKGFLEHE